MRSGSEGKGIERGLATPTYLVVCYQNQPLGEGELYAAVCHLLYLARHRSIAAYPYGAWAPPICHGGHEDAEELLGEGHVTVVEILVDPV